MKIILAALFTCASFAQTLPQQKKQPPKKPPPETFIQWLARVTGISATSSGLKGLRMELAGDIWLAQINEPGGHRLTFDGNYSWPIFSKDDQTIIAIRDRELWSIPVSGAQSAKLPHSPPGVTSLIATGEDGIVMFVGENVGLFNTGSGEFLPFKAETQEDRSAIARLREPRRSYGNITVSENGPAIEVEINRQIHELATPGERLGEPSLSHDLKHIVYIRTK